MIFNEGKGAKGRLHILSHILSVIIAFWEAHHPEVVTKIYHCCGIICIMFTMRGKSLCVKVKWSVKAHPHATSERKRVGRWHPAPLPRREKLKSTVAAWSPCRDELVQDWGCPVAKSIPHVQLQVSPVPVFVLFCFFKSLLSFFILYPILDPSDTSQNQFPAMKAKSISSFWPQLI